MNYVSEIPEKILDYCRKRGYLDQLSKQITVPEYQRFDTKKIHQEGLNILDAIHCVLDKKRTSFFLDEIDKVIKKNDSVLEAGIGTGILSYAAAIKGSRVHGIEINKSNLILANKIRAYLKNEVSSYREFLNRNPKFHFTDAIEYSSKIRFDWIISENIYTGMFYEKQIQIMNRLVKFLKETGRVIPSTMESYLALCQIDRNSYNSKQDLVVVDELSNKKLKSYKILSQFIMYDNVDFYKENDLEMEFRGLIKVTKTEQINGIYIKSKIFMPSGKSINGSDTEFFGNDVILPLKTSLSVEKGENIEISIKYKYGDNPKNTKIFLGKVENSNAFN